MSTNLNIAFAGTPQLAAVILEELIKVDNFSVSRVFTQPDRKAGRGRKIKKSEVKTLAEKLFTGRPPT